MLKLYVADIAKKDYTAGAEAVMSPARLEKYRGISDETHRRQCAAAAHLLWDIAAGKEYYDSDGKPCMDGGYISISHSGDMVLVALSDSPVGVDIQKIRPVDVDALGKKMFTAAEQQMGDDFFTLWVKKESMLKKLGLGIKGRRHEMGDHRFIMLPDFSGYAAAICTDCDGYELIEK